MAGRAKAAANPGGVLAVRQAGVAELELQRHGFEPHRAFSVEVDEEEEPAVVPEHRVERVVKQRELDEREFQELLRRLKDEDDRPNEPGPGDEPNV